MAGVALHRVEKRGGNNGVEPLLHLVFVHGLGGDHRKTWESKTGYWPQWVADSHSHVQVWSLSYPAKLGEWIQGPVQQQGIKDLSAAVAERFWSDLKPQTIPIIFVCHSLGGLLVKQVLVNATAQSPSAKTTFDPEQVKAILFLATPHKGSGLANLLTAANDLKGFTAAQIAAFFGALFGADSLTTPAMKALAARGAGEVLTTTELVTALEKNNETLHTLTAKFSELCGQHKGQGQPLLIKQFAEGKVTGFWKLGQIVVDEKSANLDLSDVPLPVLAHEDHISIAKPLSQSGQVCSTLDRLIDCVVESHDLFQVGTPLQNSVASVVHKQLTQFPKLLDLPAWISLPKRDARAISKRLAQADVKEIPQHLDDLAIGFEDADMPAQAIITVGGALALLMLAEDDEAVTVIARRMNSEIKLPSELNRRYVDLAIEAWHANLRKWPVRLGVSAADAAMPRRLVAGSLVFEPENKSPNGWTPQLHVRNLAYQLADEGLETLRGRKTVHTAVDGDERERQIKDEFGNKDAALKAEAHTQIEALHRQQRGILVDARTGAFACEEFKQMLIQYFSDLIVLVTPSDQCVDDSKYANANKPLRNFIEKAIQHDRI